MHIIAQNLADSTHNNHYANSSSHHSINKIHLEKNHSSLTRKSQLHCVIKNEDCSPDYLAINCKL